MPHRPRQRALTMSLPFPLAAALMGCALVGCALVGCDGPGLPDSGAPDTGTDDAGPELQPDAEINEGCPTWPHPTAQPGDPIDGDTYETFAMPLFQRYCVRCHSTTLVDPMDRNFAPAGFNWDDEVSVRDHLDRIRRAIGVLNFMPPSDPRPTCAERYEMVRWIDAAAP
ncbi:MAG: hypothetical protein AB7S26_31180 [Sandaracinaceae bacterium]